MASALFNKCEKISCPLSRHAADREMHHAPRDDKPSIRGDKKTRAMFIAAWLWAASMAWLSAGCAVPQPQNTPVSQRLEIDAATGRAYWLYVPSTYHPDKPSPLIVTCHGTWPYDVYEDHIREWKMLGEKNGCIVIAPELQGTDGLFRDGPVGDMLKDENYIISIIGSLGYRYNIDLANVMITGFSGGGFPMYWVGLRHPELFSVIAARSCNFAEGNIDGWYPLEAKTMPMMIYMGEHDPGAIQSQSQNAVTYFRQHGFRVETKIVQGIGHERRPEVAMEFFRRNWRIPRPSLPQGR